MEGFENWWDIIWKAQKERGDEFTTMTPEHGPPSYQQTIPFSGEPVAHIWDVNREFIFGCCYLVTGRRC